MHDVIEGFEKFIAAVSNIRRTLRLNTNWDFFPGEMEA